MGNSGWFMGSKTHPRTCHGPTFHPHHCRFVGSKGPHITMHVSNCNSLTLLDIYRDATKVVGPLCSSLVQTCIYHNAFSLATPYLLFPLPPFFFKKCEKTKIPSTPSLPPMFSVSPPFLTLFLPLLHSLLSSHSLCLLSLSPPTHPSHWPLSLVRTLQAVAEQRSNSDDVLCEVFFVFFLCYTET